MQIEIGTLTTEIFYQLYMSAGWSPPCKEQIKTALENSTATFTAYDGEKAIGMIRLIGDGGMSFYIKDFVVIPEYRSGGTGSMLLAETENYIRTNISHGWAVSLELISTKEAVDFYKKKGFVECLLEYSGSGMIKMIR